MKVLIASKANLVGTYQTKLTALAAEPDIELGVLVPPTWDDPSGQIRFEPAHTDGYTLWVDPIQFNGNYHLYRFQSLARRLDQFKPDLLHIDEEPYNLATAHAVWLARRRGIKTIFFTWQNLNRTYPIPFRQMESWVLNRVDGAIWGNAAARAVFEAKGYRGSGALIPQFGVSTEIFHPPSPPRPGDPVEIGFVGRLIEGKGIDLLIKAVSQLEKGHPWRLSIIGDGPLRADLETLCKLSGVSNSIRFLGSLPSADIPARLRELDIAVLPSRTLPNWKEQFGRILIEAMASECAVIGSDSGEIPHVIGEAGFVFPENDAAALTQQLQALVIDREQRTQLGRLGRERVLQHYTQAEIAARTADYYRRIGTA